MPKHRINSKMKYHSNMDNEYLLQVKVKNNLLFENMKIFGLKTIADLSRATGLLQTELSRIANLKLSVYNRLGYVRPSYQRLADYFGVSAEALCPERLHYDALSINQSERAISERDVKRISSIFINPMLEAQKTEKAHLVDKAMKVLLKDRERKVIIDRFMSNKTLAEIGEDLDISRDRVRQIESKALRKLRGAHRTPKEPPIGAEKKKEALRWLRESIDLEQGK